MSCKLLVLLSITAVLVYAGVSELAAQDQASSSDAVKLAYMLKPGETVRYRISEKLAGTRTFPGSSTPTPIDAELSAVIRIQCTQMLPEGAMVLAVDTESGSMKLNGRTSSGYQPPKDVRTLCLASTGKSAEPVKVNSAQAGKRRPVIDFGTPEAIIFTAILSGSPVAVGDTWADEMPLPMDTSSILKLGFRLESVQQLETGRTAAIRQSLSTAIVQDSQNDPSRPHGTQEGQADLMFSIDTGRLVSAEGTLRSTLATPVEMPAIPGATAGVPVDNVSRISIECKYKVELLGTEAIPKTADVAK